MGRNPLPRSGAKRRPGQALCSPHIFELLKRIRHVFRLVKMKTLLFQQGIGFSSESVESIILGVLSPDK